MSPPTKADLRRDLMARRAALSPEARRAAAAAIQAHLLPLVDLQPPRQLTVAAYAALPAEVQVDPVLQHLCARYGAVALPVFGAGAAPALAACDDPAALAPGERGVRVPPQPWRFVEPACVDIILVPGVAFDSSGARLGRGAGFYDRLLAQVAGRRIAVAYEFQMVHRLPAEPHDARVDMIVTEKRTYATGDWRFDTV